MCRANHENTQPNDRLNGSGTALKLDVAIIGAGVGGLSAAIALSRDGHRVTVYESAPELSEIGAGVQMSPNGVSWWLKWGLGKSLLEKSSLPSELNLRRWREGDLISRTQLNPDFEQRFGAPYLVLHRADLHRALYQHALELGVTIKVARRAVDYDFDTPVITLATGEIIQPDLVVAVDGINSFARTQLLGTAEKGGPHRTGVAAYRLMVEVSDLLADPETAWIVHSRDLNLWVGNHCSAMAYMICNGSRLNLVLSHPDERDTSNMSQEELTQEMLSYFYGWDPELMKIVQKKKTIHNWPLFEVDPLDKWVSESGKFILIGDASHAMVPYLSMGVSMAVEDAAALSKALSYATDKQNLKPFLQLVEKTRTSRTRQVQKASLVNGQVLHMCDGPQQEARDAEMRPSVEGKSLDRSPYGINDRATQAWCYGYDVERDIEMTWTSAYGDR
ncbi:monooxygenase [Penicillium cinerascens]|uniref:Monooxygenase n=1 Tax=Penicillium cinerascens TaxID=70096 RepID=A0A9W9NG38_9EURO|nr:monooxygenase [Penicillium cinerascens]KAJ5218109.1 monooxygenase [Penicillium cinerascens]